MKMWCVSVQGSQRCSKSASSSAAEKSLVPHKRRVAPSLSDLRSTSPPPSLLQLQHYRQLADHMREAVILFGKAPVLWGVDSILGTSVLKRSEW